MEMEGLSDFPMDLPPGFRFHPSDEELITHYLKPKVVDGSFSTVVIGDVDLNKVEPWDLPWKAKMGEKEWYFFCLRGRKYPTGSRTNRATQAGYWKATGKDKEIYALKSFLGIGMKKTLVFYTGRAPKGEKSNWVMHEYRLLMHRNNSPNLHNNEWVICRVFKKAPGGKKIHISCLPKNHGTSGPHLPSLVDLEQTTEGFNHVTCFSNSINGPLLDNSSQPAICQDYSLMQDESVFQLLLDTNTRTPLLNAMSSTSMNLYDDQEFPGISMGQVDLDCLWNY